MALDLEMTAPASTGPGWLATLTPWQRERAFAWWLKREEGKLSSAGPLTRHDVAEMLKGFRSAFRRNDGEGPEGEGGGDQGAGPPPVESIAPEALAEMKKLRIL